MTFIPSETRDGRVRRPRRTSGYIESYGQGRICAEPGCDTTLSRYNKAALCWRHAERIDDAPYGNT